MAWLTGILERHPPVLFALFSVACGVVVFHVRTTFGTVAAIVAVTALLTFPRIFSEAHFATLDAQMTAWWLILWAIDLLARSDTAALVRVGVVAVRLQAGGLANPLDLGREGGEGRLGLDARP